MNKFLKKSGFALVEVLVAVSLLSATIITVSALTISMMRANSLNQNHLIATELSREGIEIVRNMRDTNWRNYRNWLTDIHYGLNQYIFSIDGNGIATDDTLYKREEFGYTEYSHSENGGVLTPFHRTITVTPVLFNSDALGGFFDENLPDDYVFKVLVESRVYWTERERDREIKLYTELTDWNE